MSDSIITAVACAVAVILTCSGLRDLKKYWQEQRRIRRQKAQLEDQMADLQARPDESDEAYAQGGPKDNGPS